MKLKTEEDLDILAYRVRDLVYKHTNIETPDEIVRDLLEVMATNKALEFIENMLRDESANTLLGLSCRFDVPKQKNGKAKVRKKSKGVH